jgi:hypothetical protein
VPASHVAAGTGVKVGGEVVNELAFGNSLAIYMYSTRTLNIFDYRSRTIGSPAAFHHSAPRIQKSGRTKTYTLMTGAFF